MAWLDPDVTEGSLPYSERAIIVFMAATFLSIAALSGATWGWWVGMGRSRWRRMTEKDAQAWACALEQAAMRRRQQLIASEAGSHSIKREHASLSSHKSAATFVTVDSYAPSDRHLLAAPTPGDFSPPQLGTSPPGSAANSRPSTMHSYLPYSTSIRDSTGSDLGLLSEPLETPRSRSPRPAGPRRLRLPQLAMAHDEQALARSLSWRHRRAQQVTAPRLPPSDEAADDEAATPHAALISSTSRARGSVSLTRNASSRSYNGRPGARHGGKASISSIRGSQSISRAQRVPDMQLVSPADGARRALQQKQGIDVGTNLAPVGPPLTPVHSAPQSWRSSEVPDPMAAGVQAQRRGSGFFARLGAAVSAPGRGESSSAGSSHDKAMSLALQPIAPPSPYSQRPQPLVGTPTGTPFDFPNSLAYPPLQPSTQGSQGSPLLSAQAGFYTPQSYAGPLLGGSAPATPRSALPATPLVLSAPDSAAHPATQRDARPETLVRYGLHDSAPSLL